MIREVIRLENTLITSYIDKNYYVIGNEDVNIFYLASLISEISTSSKKAELSSILLNYCTSLRERDRKKIFISKESEYGQILKHLIRTENIQDEMFILRRGILVNALINSIVTNENSNYNLDISTIKNLIANFKEGDIRDNFKQFRDPLTLMDIIKIGRKQSSYLGSLTPALTGYEDEGLLPINGMIYEFNIKTKEIKELEKKNDKKQRRRINN